MTGGGPILHGPAEQVGIAGFTRPWLPRKDRSERRIALHEFLKRGLHVVERVEAIHAFGTAAEFAGSLRAA